jgi:hypothetical protein
MSQCVTPAIQPSTARGEAWRHFCSVAVFVIRICLESVKPSTTVHQKTGRKTACHIRFHESADRARCVDCILLSKIGEGDAMNELVGRIRAEFLEMPGLRLTVAQASRLWGLDEGACRHVIDLLIDSSFLRWTPGGLLARIGE